MIEMYAFIVAFTAQVIILSVVYPMRVVGHLRGQINRYIGERAPPIDAAAAALVDRRLLLLRRLGFATAVVGLLLLAAMIRYMLRPDWDDGPLEAVVPAYFFLQLLPMLAALVVAGRFHELLKRSLPTGRRKALLQPRGLFDFVPRSAVLLAAIAYVLYFVLLLYVDRHPFPGFAGLPVNLAMITLLYVVMAFTIWMTLRTRGSTPLQGHDDRMRSVGIAVRICVYACIALVAFMSLNFALVLLDMQRWEPFFLSISLVVCAVLTFTGSMAQLRIPEPADAAKAAGAH